MILGPPSQCLTLRNDPRPQPRSRTPCLHVDWSASEVDRVCSPPFPRDPDGVSDVGVDELPDEGVDVVMMASNWRNIAATSCFFAVVEVRQAPTSRSWSDDVA